jgi:hypothetical protein
MEVGMGTFLKTNAGQLSWVVYPRHIIGTVGRGLGCELFVILGLINLLL